MKERNNIKKCFLALVSILAIVNVANAQSTTQLTSPVGIGILTANDDLHIHDAVLRPYDQGIEDLRDEQYF